MANSFTVPVTAAQIGTYFLRQYYQVLQEQPEFVHQFYTNGSTVIRIDGNSRETATALINIHLLIMSLSCTGFEIKAAQSVESWNGGVLVMVSGFVRVKNFIARRKFAQTFFLVPQEKGYIVLNDIFHFIDEDPLQHHVSPFFPQNHFDSRLLNSAPITEPVSKYVVEEEVQAREFVVSGATNENSVVQSNHVPEQCLHQPVVSEGVTAENYYAEDPDGSLQTAIDVVQETDPVSAEEPVGEPLKHTYASILRVAKEQSAPVVTSQANVNITSSTPSEKHTPQTISPEPLVSSVGFQSAGVDAVYEASAAIDDEGEVKSVYVRNVPPTLLELEIEEEFKKFGKIRLDGVAIRSRKDIGVCYAFVEFEEITGVQNAIKAGKADVAGNLLYIEERRPNSGIPFRGGRGRGRGRGSYISDYGRGRFGPRNFIRGYGHDSVDRDYVRPSRGNGFYRPVIRNNVGFADHPASRNGETS